MTRLYVWKRAKFARHRISLSISSYSSQTEIGFVGAEAGLLSSILGEPGSTKSCEGHLGKEEGGEEEG